MKTCNLIIFLISYIQIIEADPACDKLGIHMYGDIGCLQASNATDCPSFEDCKYELVKGKCLYRGYVYNDGEYISAKVNDSSCNFGCVCKAPKNETGNFLCAQGSCGSWGALIQPGCHFKYSLNACCPTSTDCENSTLLASCKVDDKVYKEGERFYPKDTCLTCICTSDYNGTNQGPYCQKRPCAIELRHAADLENNCAPVYYKGEDDEALCCPDTFICPSTNDVIIEDKLFQSAKTCKYGTQDIKQGNKLQRSLTQYGKNTTVTCECLSPPWLTCTSVY